tara:strand:- start:38243 stop:39142 length:900 start_codon:yes stop_codon:yes gene_type:complete
MNPGLERQIYTNTRDMYMHQPRGFFGGGGGAASRMGWLSRAGLVGLGSYLGSQMPGDDTIGGLVGAAGGLALSSRHFRGSAAGSAAFGRGFLGGGREQYKHTMNFYRGQSPSQLMGPSGPGQFAMPQRMEGPQQLRLTDAGSRASRTRSIFGRQFNPGRMGSHAGTVAGVGGASARHYGGMALSNLRGPAGVAMRSGVPGFIARAGAAYGIFSMASGVYRGIMGQGGSRVQSQMRAIIEQNVYNTSDIAGMGGPARFSSDYIESAYPVLPGFQQARNWTPEELGATGDLVFALNNSRRQ